MKKIRLIWLILFAFSNIIYAQRALKVGNNPATINSSAALEVESTTKGFLPPRMTSAQMLAIPSPAQGLMVFCTDCDPVGLRINNGTFSAPVFQYFGVNISSAWNNNTATGIASTGVSTIIDANTIKTVLTSTGSDQFVIPPPGCTNATFVLWGAGGHGGGSSTGGSGGFATGVTTSIPSSYTVIVGGGYYGGGGWNSAGQYLDDASGPGGGRSAIIASGGVDVIVAGGGGGGGMYGGGGGGGGTTGTIGQASLGGNFGTQTAGGAAIGSGLAGQKNIGGNATGRQNGGGGGGGYYGGSGGGANSGGGGGSGYIAPNLTSASLSSGSAGFTNGAQPPQTNHPDYVSNVGKGSSNDGYSGGAGAGRVVIYWRK